MPRRLALKLLAALTAFGAVFAMAATLGVTSNDLGAGTQTVAACDPDGVTVDYPTPTFNSTSDNYEIGSVTISGIADACDNQAIAVTLQDASGTTLSSSAGSDTVTPDLVTTNLTAVTVALAAAVDAQAVETVHVTIAE